MGQLLCKMPAVWTILMDSWVTLRGMPSGLQKKRKENWKLSLIVYHNPPMRETVRRWILHRCILYLTIYAVDWVVQLGPPTFSSNQYQYAVVTDPCKLNLFVLARNVTEFKMNYENGVRMKLMKQGFTRFYNRPTETYQGNDCLYTQPWLIHALFIFHHTSYTYQQECISNKRESV